MIWCDYDEGDDGYVIDCIAAADFHSRGGRVVWLFESFFLFNRILPQYLRMGVQCGDKIQVLDHSEPRKWSSKRKCFTLIA